MLTARVDGLVEEIDSGGHTHRRIFEIAEAQARFDAAPFVRSPRTRQRVMMPR